VIFTLPKFARSPAPATVCVPALDYLGRSNTNATKCPRGPRRPRGPRKVQPQLLSWAVSLQCKRGLNEGKKFYDIDTSWWRHRSGPCRVRWTRARRRGSTPSAGRQTSGPWKSGRVWKKWYKIIANSCYQMAAQVRVFLSGDTL